MWRRCVVAFLSFTVLIFCCYCLFAFRYLRPDEHDEFWIGPSLDMMAISPPGYRLLGVSLGQSGGETPEAETGIEGYEAPEPPEPDETEPEQEQEPVTAIESYLRAMLGLQIVLVACGVVWLILYPLRVLTR
jgi:hypothetical protein